MKLSSMNCRIEMIFELQSMRISSIVLWTLYSQNIALPHHDQEVVTRQSMNRLFHQAHGLLLSPWQELPLLHSLQYEASPKS